MTTSSNYNSRGGSINKRKDIKIADKFKAVCPPHRLKDLEPLVKTLKGDEDKIRATIEEWWDEPEKVEPEWEDVNKKGSKKNQAPRNSNNMNRSRNAQFAPRGGRGFYGRGGGGRGSVRSREFSDKGFKSNNRSLERPPPVGEVYSSSNHSRSSKPAWNSEKMEKPLEPVNDPSFSSLVKEEPISLSSRPTSGNVWATKGSAHLIEAEKPKPPPPPPPLVLGLPPQNGKKNGKKKHDSEEDLPTLNLTPSSVPTSISPDPTDPGPSSAAALVSAISPPAHIPEDLDSMLPASVNGANVNAAGWKPLSESDLPHSSILEIAPSAPETVVPETEEKDPVEEESEPEVEPVVESKLSPLSAPLSGGILNMGKWDVPEADDVGLDFGFGSFGHESEAPEVDEKDCIVETTSSSQDLEKSTLPAHTSAPDISTASTVSPARPPPGLSITGMPPIPANAVLVHELETKLENASLNSSAPKKVDESTETPNPQPTPSTSTISLSDKTSAPVDLSVATQTLQQQQPPMAVSSYPEAATANPVLPGMSQYTTAVYGMGMYNYNPSSLGNFVGMHTPTGPVLAGNVLPQQQPTKQQQQQQQQPSTTSQQQQGSSGQASLPSQQHHPQSQTGLYGAPAPTAVGSDTNTSSSDAATSSAGGLPPGMHGAIPYNPALYHGQQYYQMGQPHGGVGYGYTYGAQYGGAVQGSFGYQPMGAQNGAYGQPYDDHSSSQQSHHTSSSYPKSGGTGGGYRGRNSHHGHSSHHTSHGSAHQYQNQYNPQQHGAYAAQPYMAYSVDHFSQRAGYGPNIDPYSMQQGSGYQSTQGGGYSSQEDAEQPNKGKSSSSRRGFGSNNNPNIPQFPQPVPPQQQPGSVQSQQPSYSGLQGTAGVSDSTSGAASNAGWSNQRWVAANWQGS